MSEWKKVKLGDIANIKTGKLDSNAAVANGLYPFFTCDPNTLRINKWAYETEAVLLAGNNASGNYTAKYYKGKFNAYQRTYIIESSNAYSTSTRFLAYAMNLQLQQLKVMSSGSTTKFITMKMLTGLDIPQPVIEVQHRIATILSRYDSLIENYQKQIKLLEEAAQRLYKEWFVDLRFPGYENTKIVDGVPEGWEKKKVGEVFKTTSGGTPSRAKGDFYTGHIPWVKTKELNDGFIFDTEEKITEEAILNSSAKIVPKGSILMAMYGATIGKLGISATDLSCNQACCVFLLSENNITRWFLYNWLLSNREFLISQGKGAAQPNLSQDLIKKFEFISPPAYLLFEYDKIAKIIYRKSASLQSQIRLLTEARDRLLPKLMSGEIEA